MSRLRYLLLGSAFIVAGANAQFTASHAGPLNSVGIFGDPANQGFSATYTGPSTIFTSLHYTASLTSNMAGTWEADSSWDINIPGSGYGYSITPSDFGSYTGTVSVDYNMNGLYWFNSGDSVDFTTFQETDNGAGADATWTNSTFDYSNSVSHVANLGTFFGTNTLVLDTAGSTGISDTELAVYTTSGTLVASNDDNGASLLSSLTLTGLANDKYILVVGSFDSFFTDGYARVGFDAGSYGSYNLNVNGSSFGTGNLASGQFKTYTFEVVPEPGTMAVIGLGIAGLIRRRKSAKS